MTTLPGRYYNYLSFMDKTAKTQGSHCCSFLLGEGPPAIFPPHFYQFPNSLFLGHLQLLESFPNNLLHSAPCCCLGGDVRLLDRGLLEHGDPFTPMTWVT